MDIITNLQELQASDQYIKLKNGKHHRMPHPQDILSDFSNNLGINKEDIDVTLGNKQVNGTDKGDSISYKSYLLEYTVPDYDYEGHEGKVGAVISNTKDIITVYAGARATACLNLMVFGADALNTADISTADISKMLSFIKIKLETNKNKWLDDIQRMKDTTYTVTEDFNMRKGEILSNMNTTMLPYVVHAEKQLRNKDSLYYPMPDSDWKLFSAITDYNRNRGVDNQPNEILKIQDLFLN